MTKEHTVTRDGDLFLIIVPNYCGDMVGYPKGHPPVKIHDGRKVK